MGAKILFKVADQSTDGRFSLVTVVVECDVKIGNERHPQVEQLSYPIGAAVGLPGHFVQIKGVDQRLGAEDHILYPADKILCIFGMPHLRCPEQTRKSGVAQCGEKVLVSVKV